MAASPPSPAPPSSFQVSVIIPAYNSSETLGEAIASVRAQTYPVHELIVVDDGSKAEEAAAIDRTAAGCTVIHLSKNRGPSVARNTGIARATAQWVAFLDSDDVWMPNKLEAQMAYLRANPDCRAVHCSMKTVRRDGSVRTVMKTAVMFEDLVKFPCPVFPSAIVMHRASLLEAGLFDPTKRCCEDLDLFLRFTFEHPIHCVSEPLMERRASWQGLSANLTNFWREADRVYREYRTVFGDETKARETLIELHSDFVLHALYKGELALLWRMGRRAVRNDVPLTRLVPQIIADLVRNHLTRLRHKAQAQQPRNTRQPL